MKLTVDLKSLKRGSVFAIGSKGDSSAALMVVDSVSRGKAQCHCLHGGWGDKVDLQTGFLTVVPSAQVIHTGPYPLAAQHKDDKDNPSNPSRRVHYRLE